MPAYVWPPSPVDCPSSRVWRLMSLHTYCVRKRATQITLPRLSTNNNTIHAVENKSQVVCSGKLVINSRHKRGASPPPMACSKNLPSTRQCDDGRGGGARCALTAPPTPFRATRLHWPWRSYFMCQGRDMTNKYHPLCGPFAVLELGKSPETRNF